MKEDTFVDTFAWIAIINKSDKYHDTFIRILEELLKKHTRLTTTNYVLIETINALSGSSFRKSTVEFINRIEASPSVEIVKITEEIYNNAWMLYQERMDKNWGITDCTSFEVMRTLNVKKAFTKDKHFEQAGFLVI